MGSWAESPKSCCERFLPYSFLDQSENKVGSSTLVLDFQKKNIRFSLQSTSNVTVKIVHKQSTGGSLQIYKFILQTKHGKF